jgi:transcriptional regulator with GAF, ATPase, and Fis domain
MATAALCALCVVVAARLPAELASQVGRSVWAEYQKLVIAAGVILGAQTLLITGLLLERRRRHLAQAGLTEAEERSRMVAEEELRRALDLNRRLRDQLEADNASLREEVKHDARIDGVLGNSDVMAYAASKIRQVAPTSTTVLLLGETGVGKSLFAQAIHNQSPRRARPLVTLNCAAVPAALVESELFGHEKGAFTGADVRRVGRFELANGGTLFLDEIGELALELQAKLLRAVQDGEFERLGSNATLKTDARLIVASNRALDAEVKAGRFRQDLWYRLNILPVTVPPLRQRPDDIPLLAAHFLEKHCRKLGRPLLEVSRATMAALQAHSWPGNVRELENVVERAVILSRGKWAEISVDRAHASDLVSADGVSQHDVARGRASMVDLQRDHIRAILEDVRWRVEGKGGAAEILGMNPNTLRTRMRKLGIQRPGSRPLESRMN